VKNWRKTISIKEKLDQLATLKEANEFLTYTVMLVRS